MLADAYLSKWLLKPMISVSHARINLRDPALVATNACTVGLPLIGSDGNHQRGCADASRLNCPKTLFLATHVPISMMASVAPIVILVWKLPTVLVTRRVDVLQVRFAK